MEKLPTINRFIGREKELTIFRNWLDSAEASKILYFHDAAEESGRKGGIGKTYLLRYCAEIARQRKNISVVMADFFNVGHRDSVFLAEHVITGLQHLFPDWTPVAFLTALHRTRTQPPFSEEGDVQIRRLLATELAQDLQRLKVPANDEKTLLVFLDTFETIEQTPELAVLSSGQTFPDTYQLPFIRFIIAGRNRLDDQHPNWLRRGSEVTSMSVEPFDRQEMMEYMEAEAISPIPTEEQQIAILYEHTQGRPILIGLVTDVLNHRILTLEELLNVRQSAFEQYLVEQINFLENPLNWVILSMAHVSHRFTLAMWEHILHEVNITEAVQEISRQALIETLPTLSFVRQSGSGESFVLHDEMQRLVMLYCWPKHDIDLRVRQAISHCMIAYYAQELTTLESEQERQVTTIELLYHRLYVDLDEGLAFFREQIQRAQFLRQMNFARLLFLEATKFRPSMSLAQQNTLQLQEARLLRVEENPACIGAIERLEKQVDPHWMEQTRTDFLFEAGRCYAEQSLLKEARVYLSDALDSVQNNEQQKAYILSYLGGIRRRQGQFTEAVGFYEQSTAILKALKDRHNYAITLNTIVSIMTQQGKYEEAMRRCKIALQIREELFERRVASELPIGHSFTELGIIYLRLEDLPEAEKYFKKAFDIYTRVHSKVSIATTYNHFGNVEMHKGNLEKAWQWFMQGYQASIDMSIGQYINSSNKLGRICLERGQTQEAFAYLQQAIETAKRVPDYFQLVESLIDLAKVMGQLEREDEAAKLLQEAEEIAEREQYAGLHATIEQIRAETALLHGQHREAFRHLEQHCYYALQHTSSDYSAAVRRTTDALLAIPVGEQAAIIQQLIDSWTERGLAERYPELIDACKEIQEWSLE